MTAKARKETARMKSVAEIDQKLVGQFGGRRAVERLKNFCGRDRSKMKTSPKLTPAPPKFTSQVRGRLEKEKWIHPVKI